MARQNIGGIMDDDNLNKVNHNFTELYGGMRDASGKINKVEKELNNKINDFINTLSEDAFNKVIDDIRLNWSHVVDNFADLPSNPTKGYTVAVESDDMIYRYDGSNWIDIIPFTQFSAIAEIDNRLSSQLAETDEVASTLANAKHPLFIETYDGFYQSVHPSVLYFENKWNGYNYWMAFTPYSYTNDFVENPSIVASNDGVTWIIPEGLTNPIDSVTQEESDNGEHFSDTELVYNPSNDTLECWYRWRNKNTGVDRFYRQTSSDGVNWGNKQLLIESNTLILSPSVILEDGKYRMWYVVSSNNYSLAYRESDDGLDWSNQEIIPLNFSDETGYVRIWHVHIYKESEGLYHITFNERNASLYWGTSVDGKSFGNIHKIMSPRIDKDGWDNRELYRSSLIKVNDTYKLYYSARGFAPNMWHIGLSEGKSMLTLVGSNNIGDNGEYYVNSQTGRSLKYNRAEIGRLDIMTDRDGEPWLRLLKSGRNGAGLRVADATGTLKVVNNTASGLGGIEVSTIRTTNLWGHNPSSGVSAAGLFRVVDASYSDPIFKILNRGKYGVSLTIDDPDVLKIVGDNTGNVGHVEVASVLLNGGTPKQRNGALRYNDTLSKLQGFVPGGWVNLNNYVPNPPTSKTSGGNRGDYATDENYLYVCHRPNNWLRLETTW